MGLSDTLRSQLNKSLQRLNEVLRTEGKRPLALQVDENASVVLTSEMIKGEVTKKLCQLNHLRVAEGKKIFCLYLEGENPKAQDNGEKLNRGRPAFERKVAYIEICGRCKEDHAGVENIKGRSVMELNMAIYDCLRTGTSVVGILSLVVDRIEHLSLASKTPKVWEERARALQRIMVGYRQETCTQRSPNAQPS